jgi:hypothetical protein
VTALTILIAGSTTFLVLHHHNTVVCNARGEAYAARMERVKADAEEQLQIGTKKEQLVRFFENNGMGQPSFVNSSIGRYADGRVNVVGCSPFGCGSDDGFIGLHVPVDEAGTVAGKPNVGGFYTDCL